MVNPSLLLLIKNNLQDLAAIFLSAETLANNLDGIDEIGEDGIVDRSECSRTGSLLCERCPGPVRALGTGENAARGED